MKLKYPDSTYNPRNLRRYYRAIARLRRGVNAKRHRSVFVEQGNRRTQQVIR